MKRGCPQCYGTGKLYSPIPKEDGEPTYICPACKGSKEIDLGNIWTEQEAEVSELKGRIAELEQQLAALRGAVEDAYAEGWADGKDSCAVDGWYVHDWNSSDAKAALKEEK